MTDFTSLHEVLTMLVSPLAGSVIGGLESSFVIAEWQDVLPDRRATLPRFIFIIMTMKPGTCWRECFA